MGIIDADDAVSLNLFAGQNRAFDVELEFEDEDLEPVNLAGSAFRFQARNDRGELVLELTMADGIEIPDTEPSAIRLYRPAEGMDMPTGVYAFDLVELLTDPDDVETRVKGNLIVQPTVTNG